MSPGKETESETFICDFIFNDSNEEKILWITNDNKQTFKNHIKTLCKKAAQKTGFIKAIKSYKRFPVP